MPDLIQIKYPHLHILDSNQLPEYIRDALYEKACQGDGLIDYCDGDFKISYSCERLRAEFSDFYKDDEDPECEKELEDFLNSFPEPYKDTDMPFLISFCQ
jgi:hypothetical protein